MMNASGFSSRSRRARRKACGSIASPPSGRISVGTPISPARRATTRSLQSRSTRWPRAWSPARSRAVARSAPPQMRAPLCAITCIIPPPRRCGARSRAGAEERADGVGHVRRLVVRELGVHGDRQHLAAGALALGELAFLVAQVGEALLQVQRHGIVDRAADAVLRQVI